MHAASFQEVLQKVWLEAPPGRLPAREQAKARALRALWTESGRDEHGMKAYIAGKLTKQGGGPPTSEAVRQLLDKIDDDPEWFPEKSAQERGPGPNSSATPNSLNQTVRGCCLNLG